MKPDLTRGYLLGLAAMIAYGINALVIREGVQRFGVVLPGLTVALLTGLLTLAPLAWRGREAARSLPRRGLQLMLVAGLCSAIGIGSFFMALSYAPVSIVSPVSSVYPLVTLLLARLFLQRSERITWQMALGVTSVVAGVGLIALYRP